MDKNKKSYQDWVSLSPPKRSTINLETDEHPYNFNMMSSIDSPFKIKKQENSNIDDKINELN